MIIFLCFKIAAQRSCLLGMTTISVDSNVMVLKACHTSVGDVRVGLSCRSSERDSFGSQTPTVRTQYIAAGMAAELGGETLVCPPI